MLANGKRVLEVFGYVDGQGIQAAEADRFSGWCMSGWRMSIKQAEHNALTNKVFNVRDMPE